MQNSPEQALIVEFVNAAHGQLVKVQAFLDQHPALLNQRVAATNENALEAASHLGQREIAIYLLDSGAPLTITTAAMLGWRDQVTRFLGESPELVEAVGAHNISLLYHAVLSGDVALVEMLVERGATGVEQTLHAAVKFGHVAMVRWLLDHQVALTPEDFLNRTPLEVAVEQDFVEVADMLRGAINPDELTRCEQCQQHGYRYLHHIEGDSLGKHTKYYRCKNCDNQLDSRVFE